MRFPVADSLLLVVSALAGCGREPVTLRVATPGLPVNQQIATDLAGMLGGSGDVRLTMLPGALSDSAALDALVAGEADLALVSNAMPYREGVTAVIPLYPTVLHVAYRDGRDATNGKTLLTGARVFAGPEGSASRAMFEALTGRLHLAEGDFEYVDDIENVADVVVLFTPVSVERVEQYPDLRLFSFGVPEGIGQGSIVDAVTLLNPRLRPFIIPEGTYGATTSGPVVTLAVDEVLVAREALDESVVYDLVVSLLRSRPALSARHPGYFEGLAEDFDVARSAFIVHPGTQAYLQREAPSVYERYSGIAEVAVTLFVALVSAFVAAVRIVRQRRKNRIDRFYSTAIEIRDSVTDASAPGDRLAAIDRLRALQDTAFRQLVGEKLSADESFQIFITLSNDILEQLGTGRRKLAAGDQAIKS